MRARREILQRNLPLNVKRILQLTADKEISEMEEIRLRLQKPLMIYKNGCDYFWNISGEITKSAIQQYIITKTDIAQAMEFMSQSSIYAFVEEIKQGFLTIKGGNRVGICGRAVIRNGEIINITEISGVNIRLAKEIIGAADSVINNIFNKTIKNTIIISPPGCGKTTLLRDITRILGNSVKVSVADERGEIAACYMAENQLDIGAKTDVLDLCPKSVAIDILLRGMSPQVIVADEIATKADCEAVMKAANSGVKIITTAHGNNEDDVKSKLEIDMNIFETIIILSGRGKIERIVTKEGVD